MSKKEKRFFTKTLIIFLAFSFWTYATKLNEVKVVDMEYLMIHFKDGDVLFKDDGKGPNAFVSRAHEEGMDTVKRYGEPLNTSAAVLSTNWIIKSTDDENYGNEGKNPSNCYRKSKLNGMSEQEWVGSDFKYEYTLEHFIFLKLPSPLVEGKSYTVEISSSLNSDVTKYTFTYDIFKCKSEAIHVNTVGYLPLSPIKAADLYLWMGEGGARDYKSFEGKSVYIYNIENNTKEKVGSVTFWKKSSTEAQGYNLTGSSVWNADFSQFSKPGKYVLAIEGVGSSMEFEIANDIYFEPFRVSVLGFFYMRIGQDSIGGIKPVPRRPLYIPGKDPASTKIYLTTMHPYHPEWTTFSSGDVWDKPTSWAKYKREGNPMNQKAWGGHSDALDWDRHLGHVSIIYDMLLPFILTKGAISDDNLGIAESGNSIPDILDEAKYEVDFWLRLRDVDGGYSHGLTNPDENNTFYQAAGTAIAAWANALNCAMLADCFRIAGLTQLMNEYRDSAIVAFTYANSQSDQMLTKTLNIGDNTVRGKDLKMMAAAFLYNITGKKEYEDIVNTESEAKTNTSRLANEQEFNQLWGTAGYLFTPQEIHYKELAQRMKASLLKEAEEMEASYINSRPSRRATDNNTGYFQTIQNVHRTIIAHSIADDEAKREFFYKALVLEADWGLGRNPLNIIQMTTASTKLEKKRSVENIYTSGFNDGTPGLHPGHTPYLNVDDWACGMVMGCPSWLYKKGYPSDISKWPRAEAYFNTRYVWAHSEFTPQQTMRGKTALYGYLYGVKKYNTNTIVKNTQRNFKNNKEVFKIKGDILTYYNSNTELTIRLFDCRGRILDKRNIKFTKDINLSEIFSLQNGVFLIEVSDGKKERVYLSKIRIN
ncbi:MAG: glycoside hydrolase family 9 protein [Chitinispirillaceae bacterium]|nr:glycoside hydrolase family 9 protein [Chitinispirillaceae bacterium]